MKQVLETRQFVLESISAMFNFHTPLQLINRHEIIIREAKKGTRDAKAAGNTAV